MLQSHWNHLIGEIRGHDLHLWRNKTKKSEIVMGVIFPKFVKSLQHFFDLNETKTQLEKMTEKK